MKTSLRIAKLSLILMLCASVLFTNFTLLAKVEEKNYLNKEKSLEILEKVELLEKDNIIYPNESFKLKFYWNLKAKDLEKAKVNDYYLIQIPKEIKSLDFNPQDLEEVKIEKSRDCIKVILKKAALDYASLNGSFSLNFLLDLNNVNTEQILNLDFKSNEDKKIEIITKQKQLEKDYSSNLLFTKNNKKVEKDPDSVKIESVINKNNKTLENLNIRLDLDSNLINESIEVNKLEFDLENKEIVKIEKLNTNLYTYKNNVLSFKKRLDYPIQIKLDSRIIESRIYEFEDVDLSRVIFNNYLNFSANNGDYVIQDRASKEVEISRHLQLEKVKDKEHEFNLFYNFDQKDISEQELIFEYSDNLKFKSITVYDVNDNKIKFINSVEEEIDDETAFFYLLLDNIKNQKLKINIIMEPLIKSLTSDDYYFASIVELEDDDLISEVEYSGENHITANNSYHINYQNKTISNSVIINPYQYSYDSLSFLANLKNLNLNKESLKIIDLNNNYTLKNKEDYNLIYEDQSSFKIIFKNNYKKSSASLSINYDVIILSENIKNKKDLFFSKRVILNKKEYPIDKSLDFDSSLISKKMYQNASINTSYQRSDKSIAYDIISNFNREKAKKISLSINLEDQKLDKNSLLVNKVEVLKDKKIKIVEKISKDNYNYFVDDNNNLQITLTKADASAYQILFKTSLKNKKVSDKIVSTLKQSIDQKLDLAKNNLIIKQGKEVLFSLAQQNKDKISWYVEVNPSKSFLEDFYLNTKLSSFQEVILDSIELYPTSDVDNTFVINDEDKLKLNKDYTIEGNSDQFTLRFKESNIEDTYILKFESKVNNPIRLAGAIFKISNNTVLNKEIVLEKYTLDENDEIEVSVNKALSTLFVNLKDRDNKPLANSRFALSLGDKTIYKTTDNNGQAYFNNLKKGDYIIRQLDSHSGHVIDDDLFFGKIVKIRKENQSLDVISDKNKLFLHYVDFKEKALEGGVFDLYKNDKIVLKDITVNKMLALEGLEAGNFYLKQKGASDGYILNSEKLKFKVSLDKTNNIINNHVYFINYQQKVKIVNKYLDQVLKKNSFELFDKNKNVIEEFTILDDFYLTKHLSPGKYFIKNTNTTDNFKVNKELLSFQILSKQKSKPQDLNIIFQNDKKRFAKLEINSADSKDKEIVETGINDKRNLYYLIMLLFSFIVILLKKRTLFKL